MSVQRNATRIISLLPSATEWVCRLGLADRLVGRSHECEYPAGVEQLPVVTRSRIDTSGSSRAIDQAVRENSQSQTSLYELDGDLVADLKPDLILTQTLCNVCAVSEADVRRSLAAMTDDCRLLDLSGQTFSGVLDDAREIIDATGQLEQSTRAMQSIEQRIGAIHERVSQIERPRPQVMLLEWADPLFCAGHWTPELIAWAGGTDPVGKIGQPSRQIEPAELIAANPDLLLVACCGMNAQRNEQELSLLQKIDNWDQLRCVVNSRVHTFDGSAWFNRPGPRLVDALEHVAKLVIQWHGQVQ